jgi:predicted transcriptional regulator
MMKLKLLNLLMTAHRDIQVNADFSHHDKKEADALIARGFLERNPTCQTRYRLTPEGEDFLDAEETFLWGGKR